MSFSFFFLFVFFLFLFFFQPYLQIHSSQPNYTKNEIHSKKKEG